MPQAYQLLLTYWKPAVEIGVFWAAYYVLFVYIKDSGMIQALKGLAILGAMFFLAQFLELDSIRWVLSHFFQISILGALIIFQPELRRGLTRIGQSPMFKLFLKDEKVVEDVVRAVTLMAREKTGALIAIEREVSLKSYGESGVQLDGILSSELLLAIFMQNAPFHDGGVIIQGGRVASVACLFPLSESQKLSKNFGTRHRAGLGLSEETDALVIVVSEEAGTICLMQQGKVTRDADEGELRKHLIEFYESVRPTRHRKTPHPPKKAAHETA